MPQMHTHSPEAHSHRSVAAPETKGLVIHRASSYDFFTKFWLSSNNQKIFRLSGAKAGDKVLDFGCGPGSLTVAMKQGMGQSGEVYGLDASPEMIEVAQRKANRKGVAVNFQVGLAEALPFPDATFDLVVSRLVIHHLPGELKQKGFAEMYRVLKPGGRCFIVDFEMASKNRLLRYLAARRFSQGMLQIKVQTYVPLLEEAGFSEIKSGRTGSLLAFVTGAKR